MFVNKWDAEISENNIFNLDSDFEISVVNDKKTADTCNLIEIEKSEKEKNICSDSDFNWNNELLRLCCNFTVDFDLTDLKNFLITWIESFFVNCLRYAVNAVKLTNTDSVNQWKSRMTWFKIEQSINQFVREKSMNMTFNDFFKFKKTALQCFFEKLTEIILHESIEDFIFLVINKIITRILFWMLSHQVIDEFNL